MLLGFKKRFKPFVLDGTKRHTIRDKSKASRKVGQLCHCYIGLRQKGAELLGRWPCTRIEDIRIEAVYDRAITRSARKKQAYVAINLAIWINGTRLSDTEVTQLCWLDGFRSSTVANSWREFADFWSANHSKDIDQNNRLHFHGDLIHWDYDRPTNSIDIKRQVAIIAGVPERFL